MTALKITEKDWQRTVVDTAEAFGWRVYHTFDSRRSASGFPDLVMVRRGRLIFAELKSARGRISMEQCVWMMALQTVAHNAEVVEAHVWRPRDWPLVEETLR